MKRAMVPAKKLALYLNSVVTTGHTENATQLFYQGISNSNLITAYKNVEKTTEFKLTEHWTTQSFLL